jgi:hypothetical protein
MNSKLIHYLVKALIYFSIAIILIFNLSNKSLIERYNSSSDSTELRNVASKLPPPRIFCMIFTTQNSFRKKATAVYQTWANKCDSLKFVFKMTNEFKLNKSEENSVQLEDIYDPPEVNSLDKYNDLTIKVYSTIKHLYKTRVTGFDWYLKADDDSFVFFDNLRKFVADKNPSKSVTYGYDLRHKDYVYHQGGATYLMSKKAFHRIGAKLNYNFKSCPNSNNGNEDIDVATCLRKLRVRNGSSLDNLGRERFHMLDVLTHFNGPYPKIVESLSINPVKNVCFFHNKLYIL